MDKDIEMIYQKLIETARNREITYYWDIATLVGLDMSIEVGRIRIARILGTITTSESEASRPMLSSVVIVKNQNRPGSGFFGLTENLGLYDGNDDMRFWLQEVQGTWDQWANG